MGGFFGTLSVLFGKLASFLTYVTTRVSATYTGLETSARFAMWVFLIMLVLVAFYLFTIILRLSFKISTRKLKNVRREYQITLNRAEGKRCNFIWDILLYQKMVILDDPLKPLEEEEHKLLTA